MSDVNGIKGYTHTNAAFEKNTKDSGDSTFGDVMKGVAKGTLGAVATVSSAAPGGGIIAGVANGISSLIGGGSGNAQQEQMDKMWAMHRESQMFNLQYLELQTEIQAENRRFSSMSNLMKVRHDTAKAAINNMQV